MKKPNMRDLDPESLLDPAPSSSSDEHSDVDFSDTDDAYAGREHYVAVGKSKLRKKEVVPLGPQYSGRGVRREELEDSDSDDPFAKGFDDMSSGESEDGNEDMDGGSDDDDDMDDDDNQGSDDDDDYDDDDDDDQKPADEAVGTASALRDLFKAEKTVASTLAAGAQADVAKGQAVKTQRKTFDTLLNTRIRLQKALISTNSMAADAHNQDTTAPTSSVEAAEAAALTLLTNLTDLRLSLYEARTGQKRKRTTFESNTPSSVIWESIRSEEASALPHRKAILERWSSKTKATTVTQNKNRLNASAQQTLTEVLDSQLHSSHLITRTQIPRSCAPLQSASKNAQPDAALYDDADFYGLLLKELLEQRSADLSANGTAEFVVQAPWQVAREAKTKKVVDTKASKGRRLRYTVQEKLQNFMAPEDRGEWGERQREELFSSLFGQRLGLGEHDEVDSEKEDEADAEEAGLMLFRS